ncbi:MAG: hypothetical protein KDB80_07855 [Planctomycetes bacterium]|nr:hypothetical protein [Planctomycetota bacterium]
MISSRLKTWFAVLALVVGLPLIATATDEQTGGGGGGGITILPSARFAAVGTPLDSKSLDDYTVSGIKVFMPFTEAASVALYVDETDVPAFVYVVEDCSTFVLPGADASLLYENGITHFKLRFTTVDNLQFDVEIDLENPTDAELIAIR